MIFASIRNWKLLKVAENGRVRTICVCTGFGFRKVFVAESVDRKSWNNEGWKIPKRDVEPIVIKGYEDIMAELDRPSAKQIDLLHYDVSAAG